MRIAYLTQPYPPMISGAAIFVEKLATGMAQHGHEVLVIAASDKEQPYTVQHENLTLLRLSSTHNPLRVNQRFMRFPYWKILSALKKFEPDVIHVHEPLQCAWAGIAYARRNHVPITLTVHQVPAFAASYLPNLPGLRNCLESILWRYGSWLLKKFDSVIAPSYTTARTLSSMTGMQTITISSGIDLQTFHPPLAHDDEIATRKQWKLALGIPILLHVGRLDTEKRVDRILTACAPVLQNTDAQLFIVGDGCEKNNLIRLIRELGIEERVHFAGFVSPQNGLPEVYRMANLFVTASEIETQGIVLLEAAASGLPIVAVNATCIHEIVHDGVNGYLASLGDVKTIHDSIVTLINHPRQARMMGQAGRLLAGEHGIEATWQRHENLYMELTSQAGVQPVMIERSWRDTRRIRKIWLGLK
jgi:glycosyltransferase involved in cell wall biosynthesis